MRDRMFVFLSFMEMTVVTRSTALYFIPFEMAYCMQYHKIPSKLEVEE